MAQIATQSEEVNDLKSGPAAAIFIAGGVGAGALGLIVPLSEAIPAFKTFLAWNAGVGPLTGKVSIPTILFFVVWLVLGLLFKDKNVKLRTAITVCMVGMIIGLLGTFPPIYDLFTAK
jgi:hypothetical protein